MIKFYSHVVRMAGRLRLAVTGIQDQWLTGEPKISYFSSIYKRHTRFSTEAVDIPLTGNVSLGGNAIARIPNNVGDLLRSVILKLTLGTLPTPSTLPGDLYNASPSTSVIQYVDLVIGGQTIQRLTGDYIDMYNQLHSNKDDANTTLYYMNGHNNQLQIISGAGGSGPKTFYLNLPFYFFRNPSLAIPICAITRQLIEIHVKFKNVDDDVTFRYEEVDGNMVRTKTNIGSIVEASVIADFYFITRDEINFLLTRPMEYVITQQQLSTMQFKPNESKKSALLKFTNPVKELLFLAKEETGINFTSTTPENLGFNRMGDYINGSEDNHLGQSISLSADGTRVAIGADGAFWDPNANGTHGGVRVYDWNGSSWTKVGNDINGPSSSKFGWSVSLSGNGQRVAVGATRAGTPRTGEVIVYELNGTWQQIGQTLVGPSENAYFGWSVSLSADGSRLAVGDLGDDIVFSGATGTVQTDNGHVTVFEYDTYPTYSLQWYQMPVINSEGVGDKFGTSVSLSPDGTRLAVGAPLNDGGGTDSGHVRIFEWSGGLAGAWLQMGSDIDGSTNDQLGQSVSLSSDGSRVAIGAANNANPPGFAQVWEWSGSAWTQVGSDIESGVASTNGYFGQSISLSSDGTRVAIGAGTSSSGLVQVYDWNGTSWSQVGPDLVGDSNGDNFGYSLSLSSDGNKVAVGARYDNNNAWLSGSAQIFDIVNQPAITIEEDRLLDTTSSDQEFSGQVVGKRSDYRFVKNIRFECNGKTMFDHTGTYLAYEQSLIHHTGCPDPGYEFYMYSFAMKPELYYPTGQLNMSRIIHKKLDVELDEVSTTRNINFSIYALNYNVLHVEGGLAGLKF